MTVRTQTLRRTGGPFSLVPTGRATSHRRMATSLAAAVLSFGFRMSPATPGEPIDEPLVVVVAASTPIDDISIDTLRRIFLSEPTEGKGGVWFKPLNQQPGSSSRVRFDQRILQLDPESIASFWVDQRIRGKGRSPRAIANLKLLIRLIPKLPGAIAYIRADEVEAHLKILKIDGKRPGDSDYPL